ncbi:MAG: hypothetical protein ABJH63_10185 [Rhizobiaceae bacterium]
MTHSENLYTKKVAPQRKRQSLSLVSMITMVLGAIILVFASTPYAEARRDYVGPAVKKAVFDGRTSKKVKAENGHEFNIKPPKVRRIGGRRWEVKGELSHHLRLRKDDVYYYNLELNNDGQLVRYREYIRRGGVGVIRSPIPVHVIVETLSGNRLTTKKISDFAHYPNRKLGQWLNGKWEGAARKIALRIGAEVAVREGLVAARPAPRRTNSTNNRTNSRNERVIIRRNTTVNARRGSSGN